MLSTDLWHGVARGLGLTVTDDGAEGQLDGQPVSLRFEPTRKGAAGTVIRGAVRPPLDLGLHLRRRDVLASPIDLMELGDDDIDAEFRLSADEPDRARQLFTADLRAHLVALNRKSYDFRLRDDGCAVYQDFDLYVDQAWLTGAFYAAARTAALVASACSKVDPALPVLEHGRALGALAAERGLAFGTAPLVAQGRHGGTLLQIGAERTGRRAHHLFARAGFEAELGIGLSIRRAGLLDGARTLLGGQDIVLGDQAFDRHFLVRAEAHREHVGTLIDPASRLALLEIDGRAGPVTINDRGVTVWPIPPSLEPRDLVWLVDALREVTDRIGRNLLHGAAAGPYR